MRWRAFEYNGKVYPLSHLHPRTITYRQPAKGDNPERIYTVNVEFGLHCFTRSISSEQEPAPPLLYGDSREQREFDFKRYELSKLLPSIVETLPDRKCFHTERGNFFCVEMVDDQGARVEYDVFFEASKSSKAGLNLFLQSAYMRDALHKANRPRRKPIRFFVILFNTLKCRPIKPPP
jgi:hypothetical protein